MLVPQDRPDIKLYSSQKSSWVLYLYFICPSCKNKTKQNNNKKNLDGLESNVQIPQPGIQVSSQSVLYLPRHFCCPTSDMLSSCLNGSWRVLAYSVFFHAWMHSKVFSSLFWVISLFLFFLATFNLFFKGFWDLHNVFACEALLSYGANFQAERTVTSFNHIKLM